MYHFRGLSCKVKKWLDHKDPIANIRGKMQGTNIFITLQELFTPPVTQLNLRKFKFSMSLTSCAFRWHKQYDNCNRFHFQVLIILMYLINIFINKEGEKSSRDKLKRENETLRSPKNGPSGLVQRVQVHPTRGT